MIIILGSLIARGSEHEHGLWFGRGLLLYFLALGAGIHGGFGWVGLRGLPLFAKIFFCLEGKYNLCTKLKKAGRKICNAVPFVQVDVCWSLLGRRCCVGCLALGCFHCERG